MYKYGRSVEFSVSHKNQISRISDEEDTCFFFINVYIINKTLHDTLHTLLEDTNPIFSHVISISLTLSSLRDIGNSRNIILMFA